MKKNIVYGSVFLIITIIGMVILYVYYQNNYVFFDKDDITISLSNESWTNGEIILSVKYNGEANVKNYSFDAGKTWKNKSSYAASENQKLEIILKDSFGRKSPKITYYITNIDKKVPIIDVADIVYVEKSKELDLGKHYNIVDKESGIKDVVISDIETVDVNTVGEYSITISATDIALNTASKNVIVAVVDANDPNLPENKKEEIKVTGIAVSESKVILNKGDKIKIQSTVKPGNATNKKVEWKSNNNKVAKVSSKGLITAIGAGSTTVSVTTLDGGKTSEITVIVID